MILSFPRGAVWDNQLIPDLSITLIAFIPGELKSACTCLSPRSGRSLFVTHDLHHCGTVDNVLQGLCSHCTHKLHKLNKLMLESTVFEDLRLE